MATYRQDQLGLIADPFLRAFLSERGIPDCPSIGFRAATSLLPVDKDPVCIQLGEFGRPGAPVGLDRTDGSVVCFSPWSDTGSSLVNTTLPAFVDSLEAIVALGVLSGDFSEEAAGRLRPLLTRLDPEAFEDPDAVWPNMLDEIAAGFYAD